MPLGKLRRASSRKSSTKGQSSPGGSEAELMASRSTAHRLSCQSNGSSEEQELTSTVSGTADQRHRSASNGAVGSPQSRLSYDIGTCSSGTSSTADGSSLRRHSVHSSNGSCRSRNGSASTSTEGSTNDLSSDTKGKRRASLFATNFSSNEARVVRVFFRDETYRSVRFLEEENCGEVFNRLWPRLDLPGDRLDYQFYIVYRKDGNRFLSDHESADVLLGSEWIEVEKIYVRHKNDTVAAKRVAHAKNGPAEVMLKKKSKSRKETVTPNPFANATGDSHTIHVESERPISKFAQAFSLAWETAEELESEERSDSAQSNPTSPLKFDSITDTICVASQLRSERRKSNTDSGRGSLERKTLAPGEELDSGHCSLTSQHRRSISSITADSGLSLHQDLDSPMLRKALSRNSMTSGGSPRATTRSGQSYHTSLSKLSFIPVDIRLGDAPTPPTVPKSMPAITSPGSHYSMPTDRSPSSDSPPPSPLPPPPPMPELSAPAGTQFDFGTFPAPPSPSPSLPPPPTVEELCHDADDHNFSFHIKIEPKFVGIDV